MSHCARAAYAVRARWARVCAPRMGSIFLRKSKRRDVLSDVDPDFAAALEGDSIRKDSAGRRAEHKARQLCRQVQRALNLALAERGADPHLEQLYVADVTPAPGCGHLLVQFVAPVDQPLPDVLASLRRETPWLRAQVAAAISRKHAPELSFVPAMHVGDSNG
jgi:ribosome-binding factor A